MKLYFKKCFLTFLNVLRRCWWQLSRVTPVICCVEAGRVTVIWLPLSSSHHRLTSQLFLNVKSGRFPPRVSTLLMRAPLKVTARQSWRREVELEVAGRLLSQLFCHSDHQLWLLPVWSWHGHIFTHLTLLLSLLFQISRLYSICIQTFPCEYHLCILHLTYLAHVLYQERSLWLVKDHCFWDQINPPVSLEW